LGVVRRACIADRRPGGWVHSAPAGSLNIPLTPTSWDWLFYGSTCMDRCRTAAVAAGGAFFLACRTSCCIGWLTGFFTAARFLEISRHPPFVEESLEWMFGAGALQKNGKPVSWDHRGRCHPCLMRVNLAERPCSGSGRPLTTLPSRGTGPFKVQPDTGSLGPFKYVLCNPDFTPHRKTQTPTGNLAGTVLATLISAGTFPYWDLRWKPSGCRNTTAGVTTGVDDQRMPLGRQLARSGLAYPVPAIGRGRSSLGWFLHFGSLIMVQFASVGAFLSDRFAAGDAQG